MTPRIIAMFNPAGALVQALEVVYRILKWIFENAARIFSLVETVVNGAAELIAGNLSGMATAVEGALARLIAPVIDFLAGFLGLGDLPDKIADTIRGFQEWVLGIVDRVVAWLADKAKALLSALGLGGDEDEEPETGAEDGDGEVGKKVSFGGHEQWLRTTGSTVTPMVASDRPGPVEEKLSEFESLAQEHRLETALSLIQQARAVLADVQTKGDEAARSKAQAEADAGDEASSAGFVEADTNAEAAQDVLMPLLAQIFEMMSTQGPPEGFEVIGENRWRAIKPIRVQFNVRPKYDADAYVKQLQDQQRGMNQLTVAEWATNRASYAERRESPRGSGRHEAGAAFQRAAHPHFRAILQEEEFEKIRLEEPDISIEDARKKAIENVANETRGYHALHGPDMIAGGYAEGITGLGHGGINSSIGAQWNYAPREVYSDTATNDDEPATKNDDPASRIAIITRAVENYGLDEAAKLITMMHVELLPHILR